MPISDLRVTEKTTVADLEELLKGKGDGLKLRGKKNPDKSVTLYLSGKSSSQWERMTGAAKKQNDLAKKAVGTVFSNFDKLAVKHGASDEAGGSIGKRLVSGITTRLDSGRHALRAGPLRIIAANTALIGAQLGLKAEDTRLGPQAELPTKALPADVAAARGPTVTLVFEEFTTVRGQSRVLAATDATSRQAAVDALVPLIENAFDRSHLTPETRKALVLSSGDSVRNQVERKISDEITKHGGQPPGDLKTLVKAAFERVASAALGTRQVGPRTPAILDGKQTNIELPTIEIGGEQYKAKGEIGKGGFGVVYLYASVGDPDKTVAFKFIKPEVLNGTTIEEANGSGVIEVMAHEKAAQGGASSNVIGMKGVVRLDDGTLGIALETAPNGSVADLAQSLHGLTGAGPGQITGRQADLIRLATFKGLLQGLRSMNQQDMIHFDFKSANCMIDPDGQPKVIDFGSSVLSRAVPIQDLPQGVDEPRYLAPEVHVFKVGTAAARKAAKDANQTVLTPILLTLLRPPKMRSDGTPDMTTLNNTARQIFFHHDEPKLVSDEAALRPPVDHKQDVWGAGMSLFELFTGRQFMDDTEHGSEVENAIAAWAAGPQRTFSKTPAVGALVPSTGDAGIDDLLNKLLAADPADRIDVNQALAHDVFRTPDLADPALSRFMPRFMEHAKASKDCDAQRGRVGKASVALGDSMVAALGDVLTDAHKAKLSSTDCSPADRRAILGQMLPAKQAMVRGQVDGLTAQEAALAALDAKRAATAAGVEAAKAGIAKLA